MISAGVDIGALWTKALVMKDSEVVAWHMAPSGIETAEAAEATLVQALSSLKGAIGDVDKVVVTGAGKSEAPFEHDAVTEVLCASVGAHHLQPQARGVIDLGAESTRAVKLDTDGSVLDFSLNDKCASGTGIFLDAMASVMGVAVEDMGPLSLKSTAEVAITSTCVVFAESEVVSQVHRQTPKKDILKGIHTSIATRVHSQTNRIDLSGPTVLIGGLALNVGIVDCLQQMLGEKLVVPERPSIVSALGAALIAQNGGAAR